MKREKNIVFRLLRDMKPISGWLVLVTVMALVIIACNVVSPLLSGEATDILDRFWHANAEGEPFDIVCELTPVLLWLLACYLVYSFFTWLKMYTLNNVVSRRFTCELRIAMSDKISRLPLSRLDKMTTGEVLAKINNNVSTMGNSVHQAIDVLLMGGLQIVAIAALALVVLLIFVMSFQKEGEEDAQDYASLLSARLECVLSSIEGAGEVDVFVHVRSDGERVIAMQESVSADGTIVSEPVLVGGDVVVLEEKKPEITGVLVVAEGAADLSVRFSLLEAVASVLDIDQSIIKVYQGSGK